MFTFNDKQEVRDFIEKKNLTDEYWYGAMTDNDLDVFMEQIKATNKTFKNVEEFVETISVLITSNKMANMSQEELEDLLENNKDKSEDSDTDNDTDSAESMAMRTNYESLEDLRNDISAMSDGALQKFIDICRHDIEISPGVAYIKQGFIEFARENIINRAIANLYDGLKPVQRRVLQILKNYNKAGNTKSGTVVADTMGYLHPHGDRAIYLAASLMTDNSLNLMFPLIKGQGSFGDVCTAEDPAAARYTEMRIHKNADEFFGELNGVDIVPNFDNTRTEYSELPVSFPNILINASSGIAVGWRSQIPSFNFNDVCDLVLEYIKKGECTTVIVPDFSTGAIYVKNDKELLKLMKTGFASLKLRAKTVVDKKTILVTELPYGQLIEPIIEKIKYLKANYSYIREASNDKDHTRTSLIRVECNASTHTEEVLHYLFKKTNLQYNFNASIAVIEKGVPKNMGVWTIIEHWVQHRREVLEREYKYQIKSIQDAMREVCVILNVVNDKNRCYQLINEIVTKGKQAGMDFVRNYYTREEVPEDLIEFVSTRSIPTYHDGGKYLQDYQKGIENLQIYQTKLQDIDAQIVAQIKELKKKYGKDLKRRTEITDVDFSFKTKDIVKKSVDKSSCYYELKNNFLKKTKSNANLGMNVISANANSIIVVADSDGRLIKLYGEDIPYTPNGEMGTYIPKYANIKETSGYKTKFICVADGSDYTIIFEDGYCSYLQTKDILEATRKTKVVSHGFNKDSFDKKTKIIPNILDILLLADSNNYMIYLDMTQFKYKSSASRTKLCNLARKTPFTKIYNTSNVDCIANKETYQGGRPKPIETNDFTNCSFQDFQEF